MQYDYIKNQVNLYVLKFKIWNTVVKTWTPFFQINDIVIQVLTTGLCRKMFYSSHCRIERLYWEKIKFKNNDCTVNFTGCIQNKWIRLIKFLTKLTSIMKENELMEKSAILCFLLMLPFLFFSLNKVLNPGVQFLKR